MRLRAAGKATGSICSFCVRGGRSSEGMEPFIWYLSRLCKIKDVVHLFALFTTLSIMYSFSPP